MKKSFLLFAAVVLFVSSSQAQLLNFDKEAITQDFVYNLNIYADGFIGPILGTYSPAQVAANHITAKTLKPFAVGFGISASGTMIKADQVEFNFNDKAFSSNMTLTNPTKPILPSVIGGNTTAELLYRVEDNTGVYSYQQAISAIDGITSPNNSVPAAAVSLSVGLPMKTEVFIRALPEIDFGGLQNYLVGGGVKHMVSQYFQKEEENAFNLAIAGFIGKSKFTFAPENLLEGENQEITFTDNTYSTELIASYDKKYFSIFGLIGYYSGSSEFAINGTYRYEVEENGLIQEAFTATDPISLKKESSGIQTQIGASVNFSTLGSLALTYAIAENNSIGFNLRFYINNGE